MQHFAYDAESRLIEVRNENGHVVSMTYDPLGRRISKTEHNRTSLYLYEDDGYEPLARIDGHSLWQARYRVWGCAFEEGREPYFIDEQKNGDALDGKIVATTAVPAELVSKCLPFVGIQTKKYKR